MDFYNTNHAQCWAIECFRQAYIQENDCEEDAFRESVWRLHTTNFNIKEFIAAEVCHEEGCGISLKELHDQFRYSDFNTCGSSNRKDFARAASKIIGMPIKQPDGLMWFANCKFTRRP